MRWLILTLAFCAQTAVFASPRVVSLNMCLDQLVLALASPGQIVGLSKYARDARLSHAARDAAAFPLVRGAEEVLFLKPDIVLTSRYTPAPTRAFLETRKIRTEAFDGAISLASAAAQISRMGGLLGREAEAAALQLRLQAAASRLKGAARPGLRVLVLARRGYVSGRSSLPGELLSLAGAHSVSAGVSAARGGFASLEAIVAARPDAVMITGEVSAAQDQGSAMLEHPALSALFPPERRIYLPDHLTVCGGPALIEAMDRLGQALGRIPLR